MLHWERDQDVDPRIEREHIALYNAVSKLEPEIMDGRRAHSVARALRLLQRRFELHFASEEEMAATGAPASLDMLRHDHGAIMAILARLSLLPVEAADDRRAIYAQFLEALARHDNDVDAPLFRMAIH